MASRRRSARKPACILPSGRSPGRTSWCASCCWSRSIAPPRSCPATPLTANSVDREAEVAEVPHKTCASLHRDRSDIALRYTRFAEVEARGRSPLYEQIARCIAADAEVIEFLSSLPEDKQQPNLLLAAVRLLFGTPADWSAFRRCLLSDRDAV